MSHGLEKKRQDAGGYPASRTGSINLSDHITEYTSTVLVSRVRSLLRTWEQFGTGGEQNMIDELREALGPDTENPWVLPQVANIRDGYEDVG
ncbi:MAG: hypothetical protein ACI38R_22590 [Rhodococcus sp. (in: high G+C Gram-positive bacteria)]